VHVTVDETWNEHAARDLDHLGVFTDQRCDLARRAYGDEGVAPYRHGLGPRLLGIPSPHASTGDHQRSRL
jgi:hypothetical protein